MAAPTVVAPPAPPGGGPASAPRHRKGRRWPRRLLIGLNIFIALTLVAGLSLYGYVTYRFGQIHRIKIGSLTIGGSHAGHGGAGTVSGGPAMNILVVGSDSRAFVNDPQDLQSFGSASQTAGQRSDTIMIVHLDPSRGTASLLSIPRDLWVSIPGEGTNRINTAFDSGPDLLVRTIQDDLGIPINHFVEVDFQSFRQVVNALGGVKFWYPEPVRDSYSGLNITTPGCYTLTGDMALSLVRARHMQYYSGGEWHDEGASDLARIVRQQLFIRKVIHDAQAAGFSNPLKLNAVIGGVVGNLTVDSGFSQSQILKLARTYRNFSPANLPSATLPTTPTVVSGNDVLLLQQTPAQAMITAWQSVPSAPKAAAGASAATALAPNDLIVQVLNGTGITGQATAATQDLHGAGYNASLDGSGSANQFDYGTTVIQYAPGDDAAAHVLAGSIVGGVKLETSPSLRAGHLVLITGATYGGVNVAAGSTPTPTTASPTTTTTTPILSATLPAFPGPQGANPPPAGSGC